MQHTIHIELNIPSGNDEIALSKIAISFNRPLAPAPALTTDEIDLSDMPGRVVLDRESGKFRFPPPRQRRDRTGS